ncbi:hypothetical protein BROSI_A3197 [Candidatus Brocadia sinica JPN1]|uniref:Uncharacterized protein n=1 Tax=Candidatus Brocadia sinica JPN1 TaxID=1197129 RepID=A0ABQ0K0Q8_9BACT|nr:hypothetical protein BROSI_A3197 [Candidatus Brocadia sinica JPN1]
MCYEDRKKQIDLWNYQEINSHERVENIDRIKRNQKMEKDREKPENAWK